MVSTFSVGGLLGALLGGPLSDLAGRKISVIVGAVVYGAGGVVQTVSFQLWSVFCRTLSCLALVIISNL